MRKTNKKLTAQEIDNAEIMIRIPDQEIYLMPDCAHSEYLKTTEGQLVAYSDINHEGKGAVIGRYRVITVDVVGAEKGFARDSEIFRTDELFDLEQKTFDYMEALYDLNSVGAAKPKFKKKVLEAINNRSGLGQNPSLLIVDRLEIYPEFRGRGFGNKILETLIRRFGMGKGVVAMRICPLQFEEPSQCPREQMYAELRDEEDSRVRLDLGSFKASEKVSVKKLADYYGQIGFQRVKGTDYMVKAN